MFVILFLRFYLFSNLFIPHGNVKNNFLAAEFHQKDYISLSSVAPIIEIEFCFFLVFKRIKYLRKAAQKIDPRSWHYHNVLLSSLIHTIMKYTRLI